MSRTWRNVREEFKFTREELSEIDHIRMEFEEMSGSVFVVLSEWQPNTSDNASTDIVDGRFYETEREAQEALKRYGAEFDIEVGPDDFDFVVDTPGPGIEYEVWLVMELIRG